MARQARVFFPQTAQLVQVRGINGGAVFFSPDDYALWQSLVQTVAPTHAVDIHAFALTETQIHLLVTAHKDTALGKLMQDLGRRYVRIVNRQYQRTGTLWEGRYRTVLIDTPYVLPAYRWLDGMNEHPSTTSALRHLGLQPQDFIRDHAQFWQLGNTPFERQVRYRELLQVGLSDRQKQELAQAVHGGWSLGSPEFIALIEQATGRRVHQAARGRPKKQPSAPAHTHQSDE